MCPKSQKALVGLLKATSNLRIRGNLANALLVIEVGFFLMKHKYPDTNPKECRP